MAIWRLPFLLPLWEQLLLSLWHPWLLEAELAWALQSCNSTYTCYGCPAKPNKEGLSSPMPPKRAVQPIANNC